MIKVYLDYPTYKVSVHRDLSCSVIPNTHKPGQRVYQIDISSASTELKKIKDKHKDYQFQSKAGKDDMWLEIDFQDQGFELAILLGNIVPALGQHYLPFRNSYLYIHC